jgi:hypothetical protein
MPLRNAPQDIPTVTERRQSIGVVDALTSGLIDAARRPWLIVIPFVLDLFIWLAPPLSVKTITDRLMIIWEALVRGSYSADQLAGMSDMITSVREMAAQVGSEVNLFHYLTGSWPGVPSALVAPQNARLTFISDMIFAPVGLGLQLKRVAPAPWQAQPLEISSVWVALLLASGLWLIGQVAVTLFLRLAAIRPRRANPEEPEPPDRWSGVGGLLRLFGNVVALSLVLGAAMLCLKIPLSVLLSLTLMTGSGASAILFALIGGITLWMILWLLTSLYYAIEAIVLDGKPVIRSVLQSIQMVRLQSLPTIGLAVTINLLMLGFRAVWGIIGQNPVGALLAIAGNAYLGVGLILGIFVYYQDRRRQFDALAAQAQSRNNLRKQMKD